MLVDKSSTGLDKDMLKKPENPWVFAAAIAAACVFLDDLPEPFYNTFHDPGAAAILSIILADAITVLVHRGRFAFAVVILLPALLFKFLIQPLFWVRDAWFLDYTTLAAAHAVLGFFALRNVTLKTRCHCAGFAIIGVFAGVFAAAMVGAGGSSWIHFYFQLGAARLLVPLGFWFAVLQAARESQKSAVSTDNP